jgi:hypothetical protein
VQDRYIVSRGHAQRSSHMVATDCTLIWVLSALRSTGCYVMSYNIAHFLRRHWLQLSWGLSRRRFNGSRTWWASQFQVCHCAATGQPRFIFSATTKTRWRLRIRRELETMFSRSWSVRTDGPRMYKPGLELLLRKLAHRSPVFVS